jgi:hypothetical protein
VIAARVLSVVAAAFLVGALALATLGDPSLPLGQALATMRAGLPDALHSFVAGHLGSGLWDWVAMPLLLRPVWLIPASLGIIAVGASLTLASRDAERRRPGRRRS